MHRKVERVNFIDEGRDVIDDLHVDFRRALRFPKFSAQVFPGRLAQGVKIVIPVLEWIESKPRHRHAGHARVIVGSKSSKRRAVFCWKILENNERSFVLPGVRPKARSQGICDPRFFLFVARTEVACAGRAADHQDTHGQKTRKSLSN